MKKLLSLVLLVLLWGCTENANQGVQERSLYLFGTVANIKLSGVDPATANRLFDALAQQGQAMHMRWHAWQESELAKITEACQTGEPVKVPEDIRYLLIEGQRLERLSQGNFNPAVGQLIDAWGFLSDESTAMREQPKEARLETIRAAHPSMADLDIQGNTVICHNPYVRIDMGAYAKGYAMALFTEYLQSQGVRSALIDVGGDVLTLGTNQGEPWRVAVRAPRGFSPLVEVLALNNESVFTSGIYERMFKDAQGEIFHHVINPNTGRPSDYFASVTVISQDPLLADAAATALLVSDGQTWQSIADSMGVDQVLLIDRQGQVYMTDAIKDRIKWM